MVRRLKGVLAEHVRLGEPVQRRLLVQNSDGAAAVDCAVACQVLRMLLRSVLAVLLGRSAPRVKVRRAFVVVPFTDVYAIELHKERREV